MDQLPFITVASSFHKCMISFSTVNGISTIRWDLGVRELPVKSRPEIVHSQRVRVTQ